MNIDYYSSTDYNIENTTKKTNRDNKTFNREELNVV